MAIVLLVVMFFYWVFDLHWLKQWRDRSISFLYYSFENDITIGLLPVQRVERGQISHQCRSETQRPLGVGRGRTAGSAKLPGHATQYSRHRRQSSHAGVRRQRPSSAGNHLAQRWNNYWFRVGHQSSERETGTCRVVTSFPRQSVS